jgi:hypothetical protein
MHSPAPQTFAWRLIRRALAAADRATRYSVNGNNTCDRCNMIETLTSFFTVLFLLRFGSHPVLHSIQPPFFLKMTECSIFSKLFSQITQMNFFYVKLYYSVVYLEI